MSVAAADRYGLRGLLAWLDQACFVGEDHCLDPVSLAQLHQDVRDVRLHGRVAYDQLRRDLGIREAACEELQDVELARRQLLELRVLLPRRRRRSLHKGLDDPPGDRRSEQAVAAGDRTDTG